MSADPPLGASNIITDAETTPAPLKVASRHLGATTRAQILRRIEALPKVSSPRQVSDEIT